MQRAILVSLLIVGLAGATCTENPPSPSEQLLAVCTVYAETLQSLAVHRELGNLSDNAIAKVNIARDILNPLCSGPSPRTSEGVVLSVRDALLRAETALAAIVAAKESADDAR